MIAFDSNVIIYAFDKTDAGKHQAAKDLLSRGFIQKAIVPRQALGEMLNVAHRKRRMSLGAARDAVRILEDAMTTPGLAAEMLIAASMLAERFQLQYFDAQMCVSAKSAGAQILLSEDMHDGLDVSGLTILNPFAPANRAHIDRVLPPLPGVD